MSKMKLYLVKLLLVDVFEKSDEIKLDAESLTYVVGELQNYLLTKADREAVGNEGEEARGTAADAGGQRACDVRAGPEGRLSLHQESRTGGQRSAGLLSADDDSASAVRAVSVAAGSAAEVKRVERAPRRGALMLECCLLHGPPVTLRR